MRAVTLVLEVVAAIGVAVGITAGVLAAVTHLHLPDNSWLPQTAAATLTALIVLAALALAAQPRIPAAVHIATGITAPAAASVVHLAFLLHGTPHYLNGLGGDQLNRVTYLTRFADSPALADPFYRDLAPFYPAGWFWVGGRLAALTSTPAWEFYKPFAIATMALASSVAYIAWRRIVGNRLAVAIALATAGVGLALAAYEPYSWLFIALLPAVALWAQRLTNPRYLAAVTLYLGLAAISYTLIAGIASLVTATSACYAISTTRTGAPSAAAPPWRRSSLAILAGLGAAALGSALIALLFWAPYLAAVLSGVPREPSVAMDFAPEAAVTWPLPMFEVSASGMLSLLGVMWLGIAVARRGESQERGEHGEHTVRAIAVGLATIVVIGYVWCAASGLRALGQSTLLSFRLAPVITLALVCAGVLGLRALWTCVLDRARRADDAPEPQTVELRVAGVLVVAMLAINMAQHTSAEDADFADRARATAGEPVAMLNAIDDVTKNVAPHELIVLSTDPSVFSFRPYWAFQAPAAAYASPTGTFNARNAAIRRWAGARSGAELQAAWDADGFAGPDVLVLERRTAGGAAPPPVADGAEVDGAALTAAEATAGVQWVFDEVINTMPEQSNIRLQPVAFSPQLFADSTRFAVRVVGDRVVIGYR